MFGLRRRPRRDDGVYPGWMARSQARPRGGEEGEVIAALYVDVKRGPYVAIPGVDPWGIGHDATKYPGPYPVVAHPPCGHWGRYSHRAHDDGHTGPIAVAQVRKWGGCLEHPKDSKLWQECGMPRPGELPDHAGGYSILVFQRDWGHRADKPTWLYIVGCPRESLPSFPSAQPPRDRWTPKKRSLRSLQDLHRHSSGTRGLIELMSKTQRQLTPPAFALWLIELAKKCVAARP